MRRAAIPYTRRKILTLTLLFDVNVNNRFEAALFRSRHRTSPAKQRQSGFAASLIAPFPVR
jgi:hypothetical protein